MFEPTFSLRTGNPGKEILPRHFSIGNPHFVFA